MKYEAFVAFRTRSLEVDQRLQIKLYYRLANNLLKQVSKFRLFELNFVRLEAVSLLSVLYNFNPLKDIHDFVDPLSCALVYFVFLLFSFSNSLTSRLDLVDSV